jgi:hypothetical protein
MDPTTPPPLLSALRDQRQIDRDHLKILTICHYVAAGLSALGLGFIALHYTFMRVFVGNPKIWEGQKGGPPPVEFFAIFKWFYLFGSIVIVGYAVLNILSAIGISRRRWRVFSMIVAGLNCAHVPLGTGLGVFTFVVLLRESVREVYDRSI